MNTLSGNILQEIVSKISRKRVYFGHQSIGFNIIDGISDIINVKQGGALNLKETREVSDFVSPIFAHSRIGSNTDAFAKIIDFESLVNEQIGPSLDIAFLKLCYVDITAASDVQNLFAAYQAAMASIKNTHPSLIVVHCTVPLTISKVSWKTHIRNILGKRIWECEDNHKRNQFNALIRETYSSNQPVFDIARIESGAVKKQQTGFRVHREFIETMDPQYSDDGGYLNLVGRRMVAEQLLLFLAKLEQ